MRKPWMINSALMLAGTLAGVLLCEAGLRLVGVSYPSFWRSDEYRGFSLRPGAQGWQRKEGAAYIRINSAGLRDREHSQIKPPKTLRIAVLGDSFAVALEVPAEDTFWSVLESELPKCPALAGMNAELINFGVGGYGTAQELLTLRQQVWDYSPDIVMLAVLTGNDIPNNSRELQHDTLRPYFVYKDGVLVLDDTFRHSVEFDLRRAIEAWWARLSVDQSRVMQVLAEAQRVMRTRNEQARARQDEAKREMMIYREPSDPVWKEAWRVTEGLILMMRDEVKEKGAGFIVVTLSNSIQVHPDPAVRQAFMDRLGVPHLFYPDRRIKALGEREGFPVFNLVPAFQAYTDQHHVFFHGFKNTTLGFGHWNTEGHHLAGKLIARNLCSDAGLHPH